MTTRAPQPTSSLTLHPHPPHPPHPLPPPPPHPNHHHQQQQTTMTSNNLPPPPTILPTVAFTPTPTQTTAKSSSNHQEVATQPDDHSGQAARKECLVLHSLTVKKIHCPKCVSRCDKPHLPQRKTPRRLSWRTWRTSSRQSSTATTFVSGQTLAVRTLECILVQTNFLIMKKMIIFVSQLSSVQCKCDHKLPRWQTLMKRQAGKQTTSEEKEEATSLMPIFFVCKKGNETWQRKKRSDSLEIRRRKRDVSLQTPQNYPHQMMTKLQNKNFFLIFLNLLARITAAARSFFLSATFAAVCCSLA